MRAHHAKVPGSADATAVTYDTAGVADEVLFAREPKSDANDAESGHLFVRRFSRRWWWLAWQHALLQIGLMDDNGKPSYRWRRVASRLHSSAFVRRSLCIIGAVLVFYGVAMIASSDPANVIGEVTAPTAQTYMAIHGVNGANMSAISSMLHCTDITNDKVYGGVQMGYFAASHLHKIAREFLERDPSVACACAPRFGYRVQYAAVRQSNDTLGPLLHMHNLARVDRSASAADGSGAAVIKGTLRFMSQRRKVAETMRANFKPNDPHVLPSDVVVNERDDEIEVTYMNEKCVNKRHLFRRYVSWCLQACLDLFNGVTVYDKRRLDDSDDAHIATITDDTPSSPSPVPNTN